MPERVPVGLPLLERVVEIVRDPVLLTVVERVFVLERVKDDEAEFVTVPLVERVKCVEGLLVAEIEEVRDAERVRVELLVEEEERVPIPPVAVAETEVVGVLDEVLVPL